MTYFKLEFDLSCLLLLIRFHLLHNARDKTSLLRLFALISHHFVNKPEGVLWPLFLLFLDPSQAQFFDALLFLIFMLVTRALYRCTDRLFYFQGAWTNGAHCSHVQWMVAPACAGISRLSMNAWALWTFRKIEGHVLDTHDPCRSSRSYYILGSICSSRRTPLLVHVGVVR